MTDLLRTVPGAWVTYDRWGDRYISFRSRRCLPTVWLDGVRLPQEFGSVDSWVVPEHVEGIEVYSSFVTTPMEFWGGCGTIAIWTR